MTNRTNISTDEATYEVAKYNITDHRHELIDLSKTEIDEALNETKRDYDLEDKDKTEKRDYPDIPSRKRIKWIRKDKNGLLFIYPLNHNVETKDPNTKEVTSKIISEKPIIGIAISFPEIENDEKIEYAVNQQFKTKDLDYDDELDQNDLTIGTD